MATIFPFFAWRGKFYGHAMAFVFYTEGADGAPWRCKLFCICTVFVMGAMSSPCKNIPADLFLQLGTFSLHHCGVEGAV